MCMFACVRVCAGGSDGWWVMKTGEKGAFKPAIPPTRFRSRKVSTGLTSGEPR